MPRYTVEIRKPIELDEANSYRPNCRDLREVFILGILYLTGARPVELCGDSKLGYAGLHRRDITANPKDPFNSWCVRLETAKLGEGGDYKVADRILEFERSAPFAKEILDYTDALPPETKLFPFGVRRLHRIVWLFSSQKADPMRFRHSRLLSLARNGATINELMSWKGSAGIQSVAPYISGAQIGRKLEIK